MALAKIILKLDNPQNNYVDHDFIENSTLYFDSYQQILDKYSLDILSHKCGVEVDVIRKLAVSYAEGDPSSIIMDGVFTGTSRAI